MIRLVVLHLLLVAFVAAGCGEEFESATVSGTVTCEGEPVPGGMLSFHPVAEGTSTEVGPAAVAVISEDGTYSAKAVIGRLYVVYEAPNVADLEEEVEEGSGEPEDVEIARSALEKARVIAEMRCNASAEEEVQVIAGENTIDIELVYRDPREFD